MDALLQKIQIFLNSEYQRHDRTQDYWTNKDRKFLTETLQMLYIKSKKTDRGDNLVPFDVSTLEPIPVQYRHNRSKGRYIIRYKWNTAPGSEFLGDAKRVTGEIPIGTILDRIGDPKGQYMSPVHGEYVYSAAERAIPYYFLEHNLSEEPSYHSYNVIRAISESAIRKAVQETPVTNDGSDFCFANQYAKEDKLNEVDFNGILFGVVAPVDAFGTQGIGKGEQYRFPIQVGHLLRFGFIEERN